MDPVHAFSTDATAFESELNLLLSTPALSETSKASSTSSRKRHAEDITGSAKRVRVDLRSDVSQTSYANVDIINVHPARRALLNGPSGGDADVRPASFDRDVSEKQARTRRTLSNSVRRQWDTRKDDLDYEYLLEQRRKEKLIGVDRYVPGAIIRMAKPAFPLEQLPDDIRARVFEYLLVIHVPITIDFYWLRSFIRGHAKVPDVMQSVELHGSTYALPIGWNKLVADVQVMKEGMDQFKTALEMREAKKRATRSPCRGLTTSLLKVSRKSPSILPPM